MKKSLTFWQSNKKFIIFSTVFFLVDHCLKWLLISYFPEIIFINRGIIFGINFNLPVWFYLLILTILFIWGLVGKSDGLGLALIIGGGASNALDRVVVGGVVDFKLNNLSAFNLADLFIIIGFLLVVFTIYKKSSC